jgi:patatin-like phospholipase/acyl hydrolase
MADVAPWTGRFQILALDGGGIKGLFSAAVLAQIEEDTRTQIVDHFDLITGTSTGGIIALGLGLGLRPREIVQFYVERGPDIFRNPVGLRSVGHWLGRKFPARALEAAVRGCFKDHLLLSSTKRLVIPSYNLGEDDVYIFKTPHHPRLKRDFKVPMWKVAMATSAAPTYFNSFRGIDHLRLIDGGVWANNPAMVGVVEARSMLGADLDQIRVLSLGTSDPVTKRLGYLNWGGKLPWASAAVDVIMRGQSMGVYKQVCHLLGPENVERIDPKVPDGLFSLDKLSAPELLGKAAHESRQFTPVFERKFMDHAASKYEPLNR